MCVLIGNGMRRERDVKVGIVKAREVRVVSIRRIGRRGGLCG